MGRLRIDEDTLERLLSGCLDPGDAPPAFASAARLLSDARASIQGVELMHEREDVAAARAVLDEGPSRESATNGRSRNVKAHRVKVAALVAVGALAGSTGLAAAGVLPDAAQDAFASMLERVGVTVPASDAHPDTSGEEISAIATGTTATGVAKGAEISSAASGGISQAGQHGSTGAAGASEGTPPVPVPNGGGTGTADTASGGRSEAGTGTANEASGGRSEAGSGNAAEPSVPGGAPGSRP